MKLGIVLFPDSFTRSLTGPPPSGSLTSGIVMDYLEFLDITMSSNGFPNTGASLKTITLNSMVSEAH